MFISGRNIKCVQIDEMFISGTTEEVCRREKNEKLRRQYRLFLSQQKGGQPFQQQEDGVHQDNGLACGLCVLHTLYPKNLVTREELVQKSRDMDSMSNRAGSRPNCGHCSIEILQSVLEDKGQVVQRIALDKLSPEYFEPAIASNPDFVGYIVALGTGATKHYLAMQYNGGAYTIVNSWTNSTQRVAPTTIFKRGTDHHISCSQQLGETQPVVAVMAVGGTPFIEYNILHDTWTHTRSQALPSMVISVIRYSLRPLGKNLMRQITQSPLHVQQWYKELRTARTPPPPNCLAFLRRLVDSKTSTVPIHVQMADHQTIVHCRDIAGLVHHLRQMGWISETQPFYLLQQERTLCTDEGDELQLHSAGSFEDYSLDTSKPVTLLHDGAQPFHAEVGGVYTFRSAITGECVDNKYNSYSIRDHTGAVHVIYKQTVETIT